MPNRFTHRILLALIAIGLFFSHTTSTLAGHRRQIFEIEDLEFTPTPFMASGTVKIENNAGVAVTIESVEVIVSAKKKHEKFTSIPSTTTFTGPATNPSLAPGVVIPRRAKIKFTLESGYVAPADTEEIKIKIRVKLEGIRDVFEEAEEEGVVPAPFPPTVVSGTVVTSSPPKPLPGVTVCIPSGNSCFVEPNLLTPISTTTGPDGSFTLNIPGPELLGQQPLLFDGSTVDPELGTFASLFNPAFSIVSGANNARIIPLVALDTSRAVSVDPGVQPTSTIIESSPFSSPVVLEIPAGTNVSFPVGATPQISISRVPLDQLPVPFAPGTFSPLVISLSPGGTTLDPPAAITFPNHFPGLPDGTIVDILGLDSGPGGTGGFIDIGDGVVTNGGTEIQSIGGVISFFSLHYAAPRIAPSTTVVDGLVVDGNGNLIVGASVIAMGVSGTTVAPPADTDGDGQVENFWLFDVPATDTITVVGTFTTADGITLTGSSAPTPPTFPKTKVGLIILKPPLLLSPGSLTVDMGGTGGLSVSIPFPAPMGGVTVFLVSADPAVATVPSSLLIPEGATSTSFIVNGVGSGTTTITASADGFTDATATVTVPPASSALSLSPSPLEVVKGGIKNLTVGIPFPAPAGRINVSLVSANPGIAPVTSPITIFAGEFSATAAVSGVASGTTTMTASAPGFASATATVNVVDPPAFFLTLSPSSLFVPQGATATLAVKLSSAAAPGGTNVSLVSGNPGIATVTASVFISEGQSSANATVTGAMAGTTTVTASAAGFGSATATVNVTAPAAATLILLPDPLAVPQGGTGNLTVGIPSPALADVVVSLMSGNSGIASVVSSVVIPAGGTSVSATVTGVATGTTTITASAAGFNNGTATVNVTAPAPTPSISLSPSPLNLLKGTTANLTVTLPSPAPAGGVKVSLVSGNTGVASVTSPVTVPQGMLSATAVVTGVAVGTTNIVASASGFNSGTVVVNVTPPLLSLRMVMINGSGWSSGSYTESASYAAAAQLAKKGASKTAASQKGWSGPDPTLSTDKKAGGSGTDSTTAMADKKDGSGDGGAKTKDVTLGNKDSITDSAAAPGAANLGWRAIVGVTNRNEGTVSFIDPETNQVANTAEAGYKPGAAAFLDVFFSGFTPPAKLYVALGSDEEKDKTGEGDKELGGKGAVQVLIGPSTATPENTFDFSKSTRIELGDIPEGLAIKPDGTQLWVAHPMSGSISIIDLVADVVLATVPVKQLEPSGSQGGAEQGSRPVALGFSTDGQFAYILGRDSNNLIIVSTEMAIMNPTHAVVASVKVGDMPGVLAVDPMHSFVYVLNRSGNNVAVVDVSVPEIPLLRALVAVGEGPEGIALLPDESKLYITNSESNTVSVLQVEPGPTFLKPMATVPVGRKPSGIAVVPSGSFAGGDFVYVANREDDTVSVIDTTNDTVVTVVPVGEGPKGVAAGIIPTAP